MASVIVVLALLLAGCGTTIAVLVHPATGRTVVCKDDLFDGIPDTIGRCISAFEQAGYEVKGRK